MIERSETWGGGDAVYEGWSLEIRLFGLLFRLSLERKQ